MLVIKIALGIILALILISLLFRVNVKVQSGESGSGGARAAVYG